MADSRKSFSCPSCTKTVKVPLKHLGKRVKCPKCAFVFRAGPKQTEEVIYAELDDDVENMMQIPAASLVQPVQYSPPPVSQVHSLPPSPRPRQLSPHGTSRPKQKRKQTVEMTDVESYCQSSGLFLIFLPLVATVLPLFGLQLRRLAKAGEFAPVAAMFLGLIGVGMICYARRRHGDAPLLGSAAAALVLISGIGGFFLVASLSDDPEGNFDLSSKRNNPAYVDPFDAERERHRESRQEADEAIRVENEKINKHVERQLEENRRRSAEVEREMEKQHEELIAVQREAMKAHQEAMKNLSKQHRFREPPNMTPPNFPNGPPSFPTSPNFSPPSIPSSPNFSPPGFPSGRRRGGIGGRSLGQRQ